MKGLVIFQSILVKKNQITLNPFQFELDKSTSYISLSFVLFLEGSRKCYDIPYAHKMNGCSGMLQDHSCHKKINHNKHQVFDNGVSLVF
jgi:hypothetical protein